ncbi:MAG: diadenylate cyclase CdaA [Rikenellaceae bacterium]
MFDFISFSFVDFLDIFFVAVLFYQIYRVVRGTGVMAIFVGVFLIYVLWIVVRLLGMELISNLLGQVIGVGALALVVVFQQEIRRYLLMLGRKSSEGLWSRIFSPKHYSNDGVTVEELYEACVSMSAQKTGALIVMERTTDVDVYASTGDRIDAPVSRRLLESIFFKNSPLHDGAVVLRRGVIVAARCILPTSDNPNVPAHLGLRHRAALGVSENTDARVIVVSEETGRISVVENGEINTLSDNKKLLELIA